MNLINPALLGLPLAQTTAPVEQTQAPGSPAGATTTKSTTQPAPGWLSGPWVPIALIALMFWFLVLKPKKTQEKQRVQMLNTLKKGDRIQTIGGIIGTVADVRDDEVVVKVDEASNTRITFSRNAIHRVRDEEKK